MPFATSKKRFGTKVTRSLWTIVWYGSLNEGVLVHEHLSVGLSSFLSHGDERSVAVVIEVNEVDEPAFGPACGFTKFCVAELTQKGF